MNINRLLHFAPAVLLLLSFFQLRAQDELFNSIRNGEILKVKHHVDSLPQGINQLSKDGFSPLILAAYT